MVKRGRRQATVVEKSGRTKKEAPGHQGAFIFGMIVGTVSGAIVAMFLTPKSGTQLREELAQQGEAARSRVMETTGDLRQRTESMVGSYTERATEVAQAGIDRASQVAATATGRSTEEPTTVPPVTMAETATIVEPAADPAEIVVTEVDTVVVEETKPGEAGEAGRSQTS